MGERQETVQAAGAAAQRGLVTHAVLVGLTPLIPVPVLDDVVKGYFRRRLVRALAASAGRALSDEDVSALAAEGGGGCLRGCVVQAVVYPLKKIFRKVFFFLEWKRAVDLTSQTYHFGYLTAYAMTGAGEGRPAPLDVRRAGDVAAAIEAVCREAPVKPVETAVGATFRQSRRVLSGAAGLLGQSLRRLAGRADPSRVAEAIEEVEPQEEREIEPVVARLQRSLAAVPDEHFRRLRQQLDARLGVQEESR
ncbi:MAG TPA: hypothetical protein VD968_05935 [Pyrinomonadaceae bacterium]|nr:hypothetical protein [Pyrinomonadaceae bacterium]